MVDLLWLIPALPFAGFLILSLAGTLLNKQTIGFIGTCTVGLAAALSIALAIDFMTQNPQVPFSQTLWSWISSGSLSVDVGLYLDSLSVIFILIITGVGFLIHLYSLEFMRQDADYSRFFAYMNLFVGSMLVLVLADNLLLLYLGWEGVGLCSYLLIGFWYQNPSNGHAARKAFIVTRIGDTAMALGLFLLFKSLGSFNIENILIKAPVQFIIGSDQVILIAALLLGGAVGKSAQLPLQTWLPDAMAGPTPVSALIHAATMVTAGVYLIARTHVIFELAPVIMSATAIIGAITLVIAGSSALTQKDIKRVLAYSTISQIGYMFLALGVGAWSAAVFHFATHAFFKALLFLGAGVIIIAMHEEHDLHKMGGLKKSLPITFWTFLIGVASLSALPLITAGFYSKDKILWYTWISKHGSPILWTFGIIGAFLTALYSFRLFFLVFTGKQTTQPDYKPGIKIKIPLIALAFLSLFSGFIETPHSLGDISLFSNFLQALPGVTTVGAGPGLELLLQIVAVLVALAGLFSAYIFYVRHPEWMKRMQSGKSLIALQRLWASGWGFDMIYHYMFDYPYQKLAEINKTDWIDRFYIGIALFFRNSHRLLAPIQNGKLRWYAMGLVLGALFTLSMVVFR